MGLVARHPIVRVRPARVADGHGNLEDDWSEPDEVTIQGFAVDAGAGGEDLQHRDGAEIVLTLRGPYEADVRDGDRARFDGVTYRVVGEVVRQPGPSPLTSHCLVRLSVWRG